MLVERAGTAVALAALEMLGGAYGRRVVLICGKGNNGADGRVAARLLAGRGVRVTVVAPGEVASIGDDGPAGRPGGRRRLRHRLPWHLRRPRVADGIPVLAVDIPSGVAGDTGGRRAGAGGHGAR